MREKKKECISTDQLIRDYAMLAVLVCKVRCLLEFHPGVYSLWKMYIQLNSLLQVKKFE